MSRKEIVTDKAPAAIGPYSQGVKGGSLLFVSGQLPIDPKYGSMPKGIEAQTRQSLENIKAVIKAGDGTLADILKCTIFLKDMNDFAGMNKIYAEYFKENFPARAAVQVARLPKDADIEIEAIALID